MELYNPDIACDLDGLFLRYKNKNYPLQGSIGQNEYLAYQNPDLVLTKNPTTQNSLELTDVEGNVLDEAIYLHGQKAGLSYNRFEEAWKLSYARTPGAENIFQEFQSCPEGKEINPDTGNCVNIEESTETVCPEGKYLNPATGRCKNIEEDDTLAECAEGYERNPETNRCRKIQTTDASEYAVKTSAESTYSVPRRFAAYGLLLLTLVAGLSYLIVQFRFEIGSFFRGCFTKFKGIVSRRRRPRSSYN